MRYVRVSAAALVLLLAVALAVPAHALAETFTNDFTLGQQLDTTNLGTSVAGGGAATVASGKLSLTTLAVGGSAVCFFQAPVDTSQSSSYAARFAATALNDGGSLGVLDLHAGSAPPSTSAFRLLSGRVVRVGVTYGFQLMRVGTDGLTRYYNFANATWGTAPAKFSLQPGVTYIAKFETNASRQFRYVICTQAGWPLVNGTTVWTSFSTVLGDAVNTYWPYLGDADPNGSGTLDIFSISGPAISRPIVDTTPPTVAVTTPTEGATVTGSIPVVAAASDSGSGVARVEFRVDGVLVGSSTGPNYATTWNASAATPGPHTIQATAFDNAGNSASSSVGVVVPTPDTSPPIVAIASPSDGAVVSGLVTLSAVAADAESGVARVEFRVDGTLVGTAVTAPYTVNWDSTAVLGAHTIEAKAVDRAGNSATSSVAVVVVDTTAPVVTLTSPANGATVSGSVPLAASASDSGSGVAQVEFRVDGTTIATDTAAPYSATWDASSATPGVHTILAVATDGAGNSATASATVTVPTPDTIPPTVHIVVPSEGATVTGTVYIGANAGDVGSGMSRVEFTVDGVLVGVSYQHMYVASWDSSSAAIGPHVITATAYDLAGNSASTSVTVWVPDQTPPAVSIVAPANGATVSGTVTLQATASDTDSAVARVEFSADGIPLSVDTSAPYSATWDASIAIPGAHTLAATAYDTAGNSATTSILVSVAGADVTPPVVTITAPSNGAVVSSLVTITASASDGGSGVGGVQFKVDGVTVFSDTIAPYLAVWDATGASPGTHTIAARAYDLAGNAATATISVTVGTAPSSGVFTNDFTLGQPLDTGHLGTSVVGGGAVTMTGSSMVLSTAANADSAICYFRNPLSKTEASSYSVKFRFSNLSDLTSIGLLDLHSGDAPPAAVAAGYLSATLVRSGVTHGLQLRRVGTDGVTRYYNFANATWGTSPTRFSLQPSVTYVLKLEVNNSGQFRYVVCNQAGTPQVNGMTLWASFSTVMSDSTNTYWPYMGDAYSSGYGNLEVYSITGR